MLTEENEQRSMVEKDFADTKNELEQRLIEMDANEAQKAEKVAVSVMLFFNCFFDLI